MKERDEVQNPVVKWAKKHGFLVAKVRLDEAGWPDRMFISPKGHTIFIEFKAPGEVPEPIQNYRLQELQRRGVPATWTDSAHEGIRILQGALEPEELPETSDKVTPIPSSSRVVSRSWPGKDSDGPRYDKDSEEKEFDQPHFGHSSDQTDVQGLAGRDKEVE
jgi:hypothetical protein